MDFESFKKNTPKITYHHKDMFYTLLQIVPEPSKELISACLNINPSLYYCDDRLIKNESILTMFWFKVKSFFNDQRYFRLITFHEILASDIANLLTCIEYSRFKDKVLFLQYVDRLDKLIEKDCFEDNLLILELINNTRTIRSANHV